MWGAEGDTHDFTQTLSQLLNNSASISSIEIPAQSYPVKEVKVTWNYNKSTSEVVTIAVQVGTTDFGSAKVGTNTSSTNSFTGTSTTGAVTISFTNHAGSGTGKGTFKVTNVQLVEGTSALDTRTAVNMTGFSATETTLLKGGTTNTTVTNDQNGWTAAYTYASSNTNVATVSNDGVITAVAKGTATITASLNIANDDATWKKGTTASKTIDIIVKNPSHTAKFSVNGSIDESKNQTVEEGSAITFPADPADIEGKKFQGWTKTPNYSNATDAPSDMTKSATMGDADVTYYAVFASVNSAESTYDLTNEEIKKNNATTSYGNINVTSDSGTWPCKAILNKATGYIQINNNRSNYYIGTPNFDKNIAKITINTCNSTASGRTFYLMGNTNTAQPSSSSIGSASTSSSNGSVEIPVSGDYSQLYIYANGAAYIYSIKIVSKSDVSDYTTSVVKKYDVTFNLQGHGEPIESQSIAEGETVTEPTAPEATGYTFGGWYKEAECTNTWNFSTDVMGTSAITLYAKWTVNSYNITYNNVEGATHGNPATYTIETATINLADASKDGFIFQGWFDNAGLTGDAVTTIAQGSTGDKAFWAKWAEVPANPSTVTFNAGDHGTCETASATEATVGAGVALPEVTAHEGWVFKGWSTENPATAETIVSAGGDGMYHIIANTTLYAFYKVKPATPAFSSVTGDIEKGTDVTISCTTEGAVIYYTTNGDDPTAESTAYTEAITVSAAQTLKAIAILDGEQSEVVTAAYTIAQHTAQFSINGNITDANNCTVANGEAITFPADPETQYGLTFMGWSATEIGGAIADAPTMVNKETEVMGTDNVTYYAVFAKANGSEGDWTITSTDLTMTNSKESSGYDKYKGDQTKDNYTVNITDVMPATGTNNGKMQFKSSSGVMYNTTSFGHISKIEIVGGGMNVYQGSSKITSNSNLTAITKETTPNSPVTYLFSTTDDNGYFYIKNISSTSYISSIKVYYTNVTYTDYCTSFITFNEADATIEEVFDTYGRVEVKRTIKGGSDGEYGVWNTFCVPFDMTAEQITDNFGADAEVKELDGLNVVSGTNFNMHFGDATQIEAGKPYMIRVQDAVSSIVVYNADVTTKDNDEEYHADTTVDDGNGNSITFYGNYTSQNAPRDFFIISSNKFYFVDSDVNLKGFRGYIGVTEARGAQVRALNFTTDELTTGVSLNVNVNENENVYDLSGRMLNKTQRGVNIVNGRKVIK